MVTRIPARGSQTKGVGVRCERRWVGRVETLECRLALAGDVTVIDDGDAGFSPGGFVNVAGFGFQGDLHASPANAGKTAAWTLAVTPGRFRLSATWTPAMTNAANTPFQIYDGNTLLTTIAMNQQAAPGDFAADGVGWEYIGGSGVYPITSTSIVIRVSDTTAGYAIADAVRFERLPDLPPDAPRIIDDQDYGFINAGFTNVPNLGYLNNLHAATPGNGSKATAWSFTNQQPGAYRISATWLAAKTNATNTPVTIYDGLTPIATFGLNQELAPNDFADAGANWENLGGSGIYFFQSNTITVRFSDAANEYVIADAVRIEPVVVRYADDSGVNFINVGFTPVGGLGVGGLTHIATADNSSRWVIWTITDLKPGRYKVALSWPNVPGASPSVPVYLYDGSTPRTVALLNQSIAPNDFTETGITWENLGIGAGVDIQNGTMNILMEDSELGYALADVVRIERQPG